MEEQDLTEIFHDVLEESISFLYDKLRLKYFDLFFLTAQNILAGEVLTDLSDEDKATLEQIYSKLTDMELNVEIIRKALQIIILRGFKEHKLNNGAMTPDTIGMIFAYLISKFEPIKRPIKLLDPVAGAGNLLFTVINHLDLDIDAYAVEHNELMVKVLKTSADMLDQLLNIYFQNTLNVTFTDIDYIIADFDYAKVEEGKYFPYECIKHHLNALKEEGVLIGLVPNDFFEYDKEQEFKKAIADEFSLLGLIELPDEMFKADKKSIILIQRKEYKDKKCLMVKLPSFTDPSAFNKALVQIEAWFENNKIIKK